MPRPAQLPDALTQLVPDMQRFSRHLTHNSDQAQDLCQDVLLKLWVRLNGDDEIENLKAYAMMALRNQYRQSLRERIPLADLDEATQSVASDGYAGLVVQDLNQAISNLSPEQESLIRLVANGETSPQDLAIVTGLPIGTVMSRLARARANLRNYMGLSRNAKVAGLF